MWRSVEVSLLGDGNDIGPAACAECTDKVELFAVTIYCSPGAEWN